VLLNNVHTGRETLVALININKPLKPDIISKQITIIIIISLSKVQYNLV